MLLPVGIHLGQILEATIENSLFQGLSGSVELGMGLAVLGGVAQHQQADND